MKRRFISIMSCVILFASLMSYPLTVRAAASDFSDGVYIYQGTGYNVTSLSNGHELVAKIDTYYYENLSDVMYCACDDYFYERTASGATVNPNSYGYAVAQFEWGSNVLASSGRQFGYGNAVAWSGGCSNWLYSPHYYGTALF